MIPNKRVVVVSEKFDEVFREEALIAEFGSPEEEAADEKRDAFLIHLIRREVKKCFGKDESRHPFVGDDWWPDHTRHMELTPEHFNMAFLNGLTDLLTDDYQSYRI